MKAQENYIVQIGHVTGERIMFALHGVLYSRYVDEMRAASDKDSIEANIAIAGKMASAVTNWVLTGGCPSYNKVLGGQYNPNPSVNTEHQIFERDYWQDIENKGKNR
jgi:hypothetical protein